MDTKIEATQAYVAALSNPSEASAEKLAPHLADGVTVVGLVAAGASRTAVLDALKSPSASKLLAAATWGEPQASANSVVVDAALPAGAPLGGMSIELTFDGAGKIVRAGQSIVAGTPAAPTPIDLTDEMQVVIDGALANGTPCVLSYVDGDGAPHVSLRGTVHVHDAQTLATWARDPDAGFPRAIATNSHVSVMYRDGKTRTTLTFAGRATLASDAATRERVFAGSPELERNLDGRMRGLAILIVLDSVDGAFAGARINMRRA